MNIQKDDNDFKCVFRNREWKNSSNGTYWSHVPAVVAGTCQHRSLTEDMKHQVALNAYEPDVFSFAGFWGPVPPVKNEKF